MKLNEMRKFENTLLEKLIENLKKGGEHVSSYIKHYIEIVNNFYKYSHRNQFLILSQYPEAEYVTSIQGWNKKKRYVKKGEHGIKIYSPVIKEKKIYHVRKFTEEQLLEFSGSPDMEFHDIEEEGINIDAMKSQGIDIDVDESGDGRLKLVIEKKKEIAAMVPRTVFDIKQTDGEPFEPTKPKKKSTSEKYIAVKKLCKQYNINTELTDNLKVLPLENKINVFMKQIAERLLAKYSKSNEINSLDVEVAKSLSLASIDVKTEDDMEAILTLWVSTSVTPVDSLVAINKSVAEIVKNVYN